MGKLSLRFFGVLLAGASAVALPACSGEQGPPGDKGEPGQKGDKGDDGSGTDTESIAIIPSSVFLGRATQVNVIGDGTNFTDDLGPDRVNFGEGIEVTDVVVASPTSLLVTLNVAADAPSEARDVNVGGFTHKNVFQAVTPLDLGLVGTAAQGSMIIASARNLDVRAPFDSTFTGDGFFTPIVYTNINIDTPAGVVAEVTNVSDYKLDGLLFIDVDATAGQSDFTVVSGLGANAITSPAPKAYDIAARTPVDITPGAPVAVNIANEGDSHLFKYTPGGATTKIVTLSAAAADPYALPAFFLLPQSGKFSDLITAATGHTLIADGSDPFYLVAFDANAYAGYPSYSGYNGQLQVAELAATAVNDTEPNDSRNTAQVVPAAGPAVVKAGVLLDITDQDWFAIPVAEADSGKTVRVFTIGGDAYTDTVVEVFDTDGLTSLGESDDADYHEDFVSDPITVAAGGGQIFVKIFASSYFDPTQTNYLAAVVLQ
jgi:hypothetical protein